MGKAEREVEAYLDARVRADGGFTRKYTSPGHIGVADRICFFPKGFVWFIEVKAEDGKESSSQARERKRMKALSVNVDVLYGKSGVDIFFDGAPE